MGASLPRLSWQKPPWTAAVICSLLAIPTQVVFTLYPGGLVSALTPASPPLLVSRGICFFLAMSLNPPTQPPQRPSWSRRSALRAHRRRVLSLTTARGGRGRD